MAGPSREAATRKTGIKGGFGLVAAIDLVIVPDVDAIFTYGALNFMYFLPPGVHHDE